MQHNNITNPLGVFVDGAEALWDGKSHRAHQSTPPFLNPTMTLFFTSWRSFCILHPQWQWFPLAIHHTQRKGNHVISKDIAAACARPSFAGRRGVGKEGVVVFFFLCVLSNPCFICKKSSNHLINVICYLLSGLQCKCWQCVKLTNVFVAADGVLCVDRNENYLIKHYKHCCDTTQIF